MNYDRARTLLASRKSLLTFYPSLTLLGHSDIEVRGPAGSGKTHFLYALCVDATKKGRACIVFDLDHKWDKNRLAELGGFAYYDLVDTGPPVRYILVDGFKTDFAYYKAIAARYCAQLVITTIHNPALPTYKIQLTRKPVLQFTQGLEAALETKDARKEVLQRGVFYVQAEQRHTVYITQTIDYDNIF